MLLTTPQGTGYLDQVSSQEHQLWLAWLDLQWEVPDRTDWYLMQVAAEIDRTTSRVPVTISGKKLAFSKGTEEDTTSEPQTLEEATRRSKALWGAALRGRGGNKRDAQGNVVEDWNS